MCLLCFSLSALVQMTFLYMILHQYLCGFSVASDFAFHILFPLSLLFCSFICLPLVFLLIIHCPCIYTITPNSGPKPGHQIWMHYQDL